MTYSNFYKWTSEELLNITGLPKKELFSSIFSGILKTIYTPHNIYRKKRFINRLGKNRVGKCSIIRVM